MFNLSVTAVRTHIRRHQILQVRSDLQNISHIECYTRILRLYRAFTRIGDKKVPDAKRLARLGQAIGPEVIEKLRARHGSQKRKAYTAEMIGEPRQSAEFEVWLEVDVFPKNSRVDEAL